MLKAKPHFLYEAQTLRCGGRRCILQPHPPIIAPLLQTGEDISVVKFPRGVGLSTSRNLQNSFSYVTLACDDDSTRLGHLHMANIGQVLLHVPAQVPLHLLQVEHVQL